jgi:4-hydroxy-2-oxoheptanedioate aldolase
MSEVLSGAEFKTQLREGRPKLGLFLNSHSPTVAEQLAHSGYDWLLVDTQHGPMSFPGLSAMLAGISSGGAKSMVRVAGYHDRAGIQQSLDLGADGVLVPYINTADEAVQAVSCTRYPTAGTRSVYFPQRSMNKAGLLGYAGRQRQRDRRSAGGNGRLHQEHRRDRGRPRRRHAVPRSK